MHRPLRTLSQVFEEAAAEARERIRRDAKRFVGDQEILRLLTSLEEQLFDTELDVAGLLSSCEVSREARDRFTARLGPLKRYVDELRIAVAERLVRETRASFEVIGRRVGFKVRRTGWRSSSIEIELVERVDFESLFEKLVETIEIVDRPDLRLDLGR